MFGPDTDDVDNGEGENLIPVYEGIRAGKNTHDEDQEAGLEGGCYCFSGGFAGFF